MASLNMVRAAERVIESGGNVGDAIDAAIRSQIFVADLQELMNLAEYLGQGRHEDEVSLLRFFEVPA
jgi:hypothetical protein